LSEENLGVLSSQNKLSPASRILTGGVEKALRVGWLLFARRPALLSHNAED